jgi:hypothetical protein
MDSALLCLHNHTKIATPGIHPVVITWIIHILDYPHSLVTSNKLMDYRKHSLLSKKKFGGDANDYMALHKFMDTSKLFSFDVRHRILLHNTYGIHICIQKFGDVLTNSDGLAMLVRDVAAEHCKEDLMGVVPISWNHHRQVRRHGCANRRSAGFSSWRNI